MIAALGWGGGEAFDDAGFFSQQNTERDSQSQRDGMGI